MEIQKCRNVWGHSRKTIGNDSVRNSVHGLNAIGSDLGGHNDGPKLIKSQKVSKKFFHDKTLKLINYFSFINFDQLKYSLRTRLQAVQSPKLEK